MGTGSKQKQEMRQKKERTKRTAWLLAAGGGSDTEEKNPAILGVVASLVRHCSGTSGLPNMITRHLPHSTYHTYQGTAALGSCAIPAR